MVLVLRSIYHFVLVMQIDCVSECVLFIFFFKQKTAYDMRISDWSSDVCSSDLRGVGGIFYDHLEGAFDANFAFTKDVGEAFLAIFPTIVRQRMGLAWNSEEQQRQLEWRGRYAEFNLVYDRGTSFRLNTGGNIDTILMSQAPLASARRWNENIRQSGRDS